MRIAETVVVAILTCSTVCCSHGARINRTASYNASGLEAKPGSHRAAVLERMLLFRQHERAKLKIFLDAYGASHGDINHPRLAELKSRILTWFGMTATDYANLPAYMKAFTNTGPYRRLITKPGYSYVAGTVFLPCNATRLHPAFETAFAYVGGWGVGEDGTAVDAGFQRSNVYGNYAAFIRAQGFQQISKEPRFDCGHPVDFQFYARNDRQLVLWAKGFTDGNRLEVVQAELDHPDSYGWPADGGGHDEGVVLKRMTTIAQDDAKLPRSVSWDADGSYFGRYHNQRRPLVHWWNLVVGQVDQSGKPVNIQPWGITQSDESFRAGMLSYPNDPRIVWFTCTACQNESDAIDLVETNRGH